MDQEVKSRARTGRPGSEEPGAGEDSALQGGFAFGVSVTSVFSGK